MRCRHAKKLIFGYIDGVISESDRVGLENHLRECSACEATASSLARSLDLLHRVPSAAPSENFNWKLRLRLAREKSAWRDDAQSIPTWQRAWNTRFALAALSTFAVVLIAGFAFLRSPWGPGESATRSGWQPQTMTSGTFAPKEEGVAGRTAYDPFVIRRSGGIGAQPVAMGALPGRDAGVGHEGQRGPILDVDSLKAQYTRSTLEYQRIRQLEQQIEVLHKELEKCNPEGQK
jgi:hypothetical protein